MTEFVELSLKRQNIGRRFLNHKAVGCDSPSACLKLSSKTFLFKPLIYLFLFCRKVITLLSKALMENDTSIPSGYVPHYLLRGDPFASKLSKEADIVAAFYIFIIGKCTMWTIMWKSSLQASCELSLIRPVINLNSNI